MSEPPSDPSRARRLWKQLLPALLGGLAGVVVGAGAARLTRDRPWLIPDDLPALHGGDLLGALALVIFSILVHEAGHWLGGRLGGMRLLLMTVGPVRLTREATGWRWSWFARAGGFGGLTAMLPAVDRPIGPQLMPMIAGGPLASALLALAGAGTAVAAEGRVALYGGALAVVCGFLFLITALPMRIGGFLNDGAQWRELRRDGPAAERRALIAVLWSRSLSGVRPRDLDAAQWERARALDDGRDAMRTAAVYYLGYVMACDRGDVPAAGACLDRIIERVAAVPQGLRQAYAIELAYFLAAHRNDAQAARRWIEQANGGLVEPCIRARSQAALAIAEGRDEEARTALAAARKALPRYYDLGGAHLVADQLQALDARLAGR